MKTIMPFDIDRVTSVAMTTLAFATVIAVIAN